MDAEKSLYPEAWNKLEEKEKQQIRTKGKTYTLLNLFVYEPNSILPPYEKRGQKTGFYMIDFRNIQTLRCELIKNRDKTKQEEELILKSKCLQLSEGSRDELRKKLSFYYGRPAEAEIE